MESSLNDAVAVLCASFVSFSVSLLDFDLTEITVLMSYRRIFVGALEQKHSAELSFETMFRLGGGPLESLHWICRAHVDAPA